MTVSVRTIDDTQYENRMRNWDFDVVIGNWPETLSPGNEQRGFGVRKPPTSPARRT